MSIPSGKTAVAIGPRTVFVKHRGRIGALGRIWGAQGDYGPCVIENASRTLRFLVQWAVESVV